jgi:hypothetical protein
VEKANTARDGAALNKTSGSKAYWGSGVSWTAGTSSGITINATTSIMAANDTNETLTAVQMDEE